MNLQAMSHITPGNREHEGLIILTYLSALGVAGLMAGAIVVASILWGDSSIFFLEGFIFLALGLITAFAFKALGLDEKGILYVTVSIAVIVIIVSGFVHWQLSSTIANMQSMNTVVSQEAAGVTAGFQSLIGIPLDFTTFLAILLITFNFAPFLMKKQEQKTQS